MAVEPRERKLRALYRRAKLRMFSEDFLAGWVIFLVSLLTTTWLLGKVLFFWDTIVPFQTNAVLSFSGYTWGQLYGTGYIQVPFEFGTYFVLMDFLSGILRLPLNIAQQLLITGLEALSGIGMFLLLRFLKGPFISTSCRVSATLCSVLYMFNFYVVYYLFADFFPSWWLYAAFPYISIVILDGVRRARADRPIRFNVLALILLLSAAAIGFWEPPYLIYTFALIAALAIYDSSKKIDSPPGSGFRVLRFVSLLSLASIASGLWWEYGLALFATVFAGGISPTGSNSVSYFALQQQILSPAPTAFSQFLSSFGELPFQPGLSFYTWQTDYLAGGLSILFMLLATAFVCLLFLPLLTTGRPQGHRDSILYATLLVFGFMALQGQTFLFQTAASLLFTRFPSVASYLYATNLQFSLFPISILIPILFFEVPSALDTAIGRTSSVLSKFRLRGRPANRPEISIVRSRGRLRLPSSSTLFSLITASAIVVGSGWFAMTPLATPTFIPGGGSADIPSTINVPPYLMQLGNYIKANSDNGVTLVLPESYNFNSLDFEGLSFIDTGAFGYLTGQPAILGESGTRGMSDALYAQIEDLLSSPCLPGDSFSRVLSEFGIKFVVLNTAPGSVGAFPWYNISAFESLLGNQSQMRFIDSFGPYLLYENQGEIEQVLAGTPIVFDPSIVDPLDSTGNLLAEMTVQSDWPTVPMSATRTAAGLTLNYTYVPPDTEVWWTLNLSSPVPLQNHSYLLVTFKVSSNESGVSLHGQTLFGSSPVPYGYTILKPLNPVSLSGDQLTQSPTTSYTMVYPLSNQSYLWYSTALPSPAGTLMSFKSILLAIALTGSPIAGQNYSVQISNVSLAGSVSDSDFLRFVYQNPGTDTVPLLTETSSFSWSKPEIGYRPPTISSVTEENPTSYSIVVPNVTGAFVLVFRQTYDAGWTMSVNGKLLPPSAHTEVDSFANGWFVNGTGNLTILISFAPQSTYNALVIVSVSSLLIVGLSCTVPLARSTYRALPRIRLRRS